MRSMPNYENVRFVWRGFLWAIKSASGECGVVGFTEPRRGTVWYIGKKLSRLSCTEVNSKFGRKCVFRLERSSLGHHVCIMGVWCHWSHRTPHETTSHESKKLSGFSHREVNLKFGRKCVFCLERSLGHHACIRGGWCHWIYRTP